MASFRIIETGSIKKLQTIPNRTRLLSDFNRLIISGQCQTEIYKFMESVIRKEFQLSDLIRYNQLLNAINTKNWQLLGNF
jgi:hypothetical protein